MSESHTLPEGTYRIVVVSRPPAKPAPASTRAGQVQLEIKGWTPADIEKNAAALAGYSRSYSLLVLPRLADRCVGFRGLTSDQVNAMRRDGLEPALVVRVGERFDVQLKAHAPLLAEERRLLREHVVAKYKPDLAPGVLPDAVRLPGFETRSGDSTVRAAVVATRNPPFSASEELLARLRTGAEAQALEALARARPVPEPIAYSTVAYQVAQSEAPPRLPSSHPVARLEAQLSRAADRLSRPSAQDQASGRELLRQGFEVVRAVVRDLAEHQGENLRNKPEFRHLVAAEVGLREVRMGLEMRLMNHEQRSAEARSEVWQAQRLATPDNPQSLENLRGAVIESQRLSSECESQMRDYADHHLEVLTLAKDHLAAAVAITPRDERVLEAFRVGAEAEARHLLRLGEPEMPLELIFGSVAEVRAARGSMREQETQLVSEVRNGPDRQAALASWSRLIFDRVATEQYLARCQGWQPVTASRLSHHAATEHNPERAQQRVIEHCRHLAALSLTDPMPSREDLTLARHNCLLKVANGEVSPRSLSRMVSQLVHELGPSAVAAPSPPPPSGGLELLRRFATLELRVRNLAGERAESPARDRERLHSLCRHAVELIQVHQAVERLERRLHGVAEPVALAHDISAASNARAWIDRAHEKGLPMPERHLANLHAPLVSREIDFVRASALAKLEMRAVRSVAKELERGVKLR